MPQNPRIALIHATRVAMPPIEAAFAKRWPEAEAISILDEGLSADSGSGRVSMAELNLRITNLARYARHMGPDAILFTCSAFGGGIEAAAEEADIPILKPNEAMFDDAIARGGEAVMLYTFAPALDGMVKEFKTAARGTGATLRPVFVEGAIDALKAGDKATHNRLIRTAASKIEGASAIILAHFSMSIAQEDVRGVTSAPVLTSPDTAIARLKSVLGASA